jgi:formylglycine-generating enzyme required for sulfatase activity
LQDKELDRLIPEFQKEIERSEANRAIAKQVLIAVVVGATLAIFIGSFIAINNHNHWIEEQAQIAAIKAEKEACDRKNEEEERIAAEKAEREAKERMKEQERIQIAKEKVAKDAADKRLEQERIRIAKEKAAKEQERILSLEPITNSIGMKLKLIPAGEFTMGERWTDAHQVTLTKPFYLGVYEVTQEEYQKVMGRNPSNFKHARNPVEGVSWEDAVEFCRNLTELTEEKTLGRVYRLPTEAEWEYTCRAGTTTEWSFGDSESQLDDFAWYSRNSGLITHPVGLKKPNAWGMYDMHGNVVEWCSDWYSFRYDIDRRVTFFDPRGPVEGSDRVIRGGCWMSVAGLCRSAFRDQASPQNRSFLHMEFGFRVALSFSENTVSPELSGD